MPGRPWSDADTEFLLNNHGKMPQSQIAERLGRTRTAIAHKAIELTLTDPFQWSTEQEFFLKAIYKTTPNPQILKLFKEKWPKRQWTWYSISGKMQGLKLKRTLDQQYVLRYGVKKEIYRGEYDGLKLSYKSGRVFIHIKGKRKLLKDYVWEKHKGPIPKGYVVCLKDGDPFNCSIENLYLKTQAEISKETAHKVFTDLSDNLVASVLSQRDRELQQEIVKHPEIIQVKRLQMKLNRELQKWDKRTKKRRKPRH